MDGAAHWAQADGGQIAYRRWRTDGPPLLVTFGTMAGSVFAEEPVGRRFVEALARFADVLLVDPRGTGASDPVIDGELDVDQQVADLVAVLDHAGVERAHVHAFHLGVAAAVALAAEHPERVAGLVLANGVARLRVADDVPWGLTDDEVDLVVRAHAEQFGTGMFVDLFCPSRAGDDEVRASMTRVELRGSSRAQAQVLNRFALDLDVRDLLGRVGAPTVVAHSEHNLVHPLDHGRYLAEGIPGARLEVFAGPDHAFHFGDPSPVLEAIERQVTGHAPEAAVERRLVALLFTDIVGSTVRATELGDRRWRELLDRHDAVVREQIERHDGTEIDTAGDGFFVTFGRVRSAIACAQAVHAALVPLGLEVRAGVHVGEVELRPPGVGGITVHTGARIAALADAGEVLVSRTVVDVLAGTGLEVVEHGVHDLKGVPRRWELFRVTSSSD